MALKVNSQVPAEVLGYHQLLGQVAALLETEPGLEQRLQALELLWQAFEQYLEPQALRWALDLLTPWPELQTALASYASLLYPDWFEFKTAGQLSAIALPEELQKWSDWLFPAVLPRISVCMIVRNEVQSLPSALESVSKLAAEIIVVDTGSEDGTQELLSHYPKLKAFEIPWPENFAQARNVSLAQATGDWILVLDADEKLLPASADYLAQLLAKPPLGWQSFAAQINHQLEQGSFYTWASRVFRRSKELDYTGVLHEFPCKRSWPYWLLPVYIPLVLEHTGSLRAVHQRQNKIQRALQLKELIEQQRYTPYLAYQYAYLLVHGIDLAQDLSLAEKLLKEALDSSLVYQQRLPPSPDWLAAPVSACALLLCQLYGQQQRHAECVEVYQRFEPDTQIKAFAGMGALSLQALGRLDAAKTAWLRCFDPGLMPLKTQENWQTRALEALLELALRQQNPFEAIWALRRLRERFPDGLIQQRQYDLAGLQSRLLTLLKVPEGTWLDRLDFEIRQAILKQDFAAVAWFAMAYLSESWDQTVLTDAVRALNQLQAPDLLAALSALGRDLYPQQSLFKLYYAAPGALQALDAHQAALPGGAYWLYLCHKPSPPPRLSLCMMVRNAADTLPAALASVEALVDEYIIADTGSQDQTPALLASWFKEHAGEHLEIPWPGHFGQVRNQLLERASGDWILMLDADEELDSASLPALRALLAYQPVGLSLFALNCHSLVAEPEQTTVDWVPRIFPRSPLIAYWGALHEHPVHAFDAERLPVLPLNAVSIRHLGYLPEQISRHRKSERLVLFEQSLRVSGLPNPYFLYHYGYALMYQYSPPQLELALQTLEQSLAESLKYQQRPPVQGWVTAPVRKVQLLIFRLLAHGHKDSEILNRYPAWAQEISEPEFHFWYATAALRQELYTAAEQAFKRCLKGPENSAVSGFASWRPLLGLADLALHQKNWSLGIEAFQSLLALPVPLDSQALFAQWWSRMRAETDL